MNWMVPSLDDGQRCQLCKYDVPEAINARSSILQCCGSGTQTCRQRTRGSATATWCKWLWSLGDVQIAGARRAEHLLCFPKNSLLWRTPFLVFLLCSDWRISTFQRKSAAAFYHWDYTNSQVGTSIAKQTKLMTCSPSAWIIHVATVCPAEVHKQKGRHARCCKRGARKCMGILSGYLRDATSCIGPKMLGRVNLHPSAHLPNIHLRICRNLLNSQNSRQTM